MEVFKFRHCVTDLSVRQRDVLWKETAQMSACFCVQCSVAPTGGKSWNRLCPGCDGSAVMLSASFFALALYKL